MCDRYLQKTLCVSSQAAHSCLLTISCAQAVVLRPDQKYKPGEQVFTSYGPKTDGELLLSYGFIPPLGTNPHDACRLRLNIDKTDPTYQQKLKSLEQHKLPASIQFPLKLSGLPTGLLQYAAFVDAQPSEPAEVEELGNYLFEQVGDFAFLSTRFDALDCDCDAWPKHHQPGRLSRYVQLADCTAPWPCMHAPFQS